MHFSLITSHDNDELIVIPLFIKKIIATEIISEISKISLKKQFLNIVD